MRKLDKKSKGAAPARKIRFPGRLLTELQRLADADRRTFSDYCRIALEQHVETKGKR